MDNNAFGRFMIICDISPISAQLLLKKCAKSEFCESGSKVSMMSRQIEKVI